MNRRTFQLIALAAVAAVGCSDTTGPVQVASVSIVPATATVQIGDQLTLTAELRDAGGHEVSGHSVTWSSSAAAVASVTQTGLVTGLAGGSATITATSDGKSATTSLTVVAALTGLDGVWDWTEYMQGSFGTCSDTGYYAFWSANGAVSGSSAQVGTCYTPSPRDNATGIVLFQGGQVDAGQLQFSVGGCTYTAAFPGPTPDSLVGRFTCGGFSGTWKASHGHPVASISVTPTATTVFGGCVSSECTVQLTAVPRTADGVRLLSRAVAWSSETPGVASVASGGDGLITGAVQGLSPGTAAIDATSEGQTATATVTVLAGSLRIVSNSDAAVGGTLQLAAEAYDVVGHPITAGPIAWSSSDPATASVDPATGLVQGLQSGSVVISAAADGLQSGSLTLAVLVPAPGVMETDLGDLGGGESAALGINGAGVVVGWSLTASGDVHPFVWTPGSGMRDLGTLGGTSGVANGINDAGDIVGVSGTAHGTQHAFRWTAASGMQDLGVLPGGSQSAAHAINDSGEVVGNSDTHAVRWSPAGAVEDLGIFWDEAVALGINDGETIVGGSSYTYCYTSGCTAGAESMVWDSAGHMTALGLGGEADGINGLGQIVGMTGSGNAYLLGSTGVLLLASLDPGATSEAFAIDDAGNAAGVSTSSSGIRHPVVWTAAGDLLLLSPAEGEAHGLDGSGRVAGSSLSGGKRHARLWALPSSAPTTAVRVRARH